MTTKIRVTKIQAECVDWALGAMEEYWADHDAEGPEDLYRECILVPDIWTLPSVKDGVLVLSDWIEINEDLHYRVSEQAVEMVYSEANHYSSQKISAIAYSYQLLGAKITEVMA